MIRFISKLEIESKFHNQEVFDSQNTNSTSCFLQNFSEIRASKVILYTTINVILKYFTEADTYFVTGYVMRYILQTFWCNHATYVNSLVEMISETVTNDNINLTSFWLPTKKK